jgi:hypothetical protein
MNLFPRFSRGQTVVLFTFAFVAIVGALALTTDVTAAYWNWEQLQKAADAGSLAGASQYIQHIPAPPPAAAGCSGPNVNQVACTYAVQNKALASEVTVQSPSPTIPASVPAGAQTVMVTIQRNTIPVYFARVLGRTTPYAATATAIAVGPTVTNSVHNGLFPAGMPYNPNGAPLAYGTQYSLTGNYASGSWGWLDIPSGFQGSTSPGSAPSGGGSSLLTTNITNGCTCDVSVGNYVGSEPGTKWGPVSSAVSSLATGATLPATLTGNEPQLVTVPIVDWSASGGGSAAVQIKGFAQVWLIGISKSGSNMVLNVQFVQYVSNYASSGGSSTSYGSSKKPYLVQ